MIFIMIILSFIDKYTITYFNVGYSKQVNWLKIFAWFSNFIVYNFKKV